MKQTKKNKFNEKKSADTIKKRFLEKILSEGCFFPEYYPCEICGRTNGTIYDFHHIIFRSEKPSHPRLHDLINIIYVCRKCHNSLHSNVSLRNKIIKKRKLNEIFDINIIENIR